MIYACPRCMRVRPLILVGIAFGRRYHSCRNVSCIRTQKVLCDHQYQAVQGAARGLTQVSVFERAYGSPFMGIEVKIPHGGDTAYVLEKVTGALAPRPWTDDFPMAEFTESVAKAMMLLSKAMKAAPIP